VTRVLFVDDEPLVLRAMQRVVRPLSEIEAGFASSGEEALLQCGAKPFDVIVSDMRMPGMDGATLLAHVQQLYPATARIILSGYAQYESALRALPVTHRFLAKPFRPEDIRAVLLRTLSLHSLLRNETLREWVGGIKDLPARPAVYFELRGAMASARSSIRSIAAIIERDAGMTGRLVRAANNAFFAAPARITSVETAIQYLGTDTLTGLILSIECFGNFEDALADCALVPANLEREAYLAANIAAQLVTDDSHRTDAFLAALLHDCGTLLLAARQPAPLVAALEHAREEGCSLYEAERRLWRATHAEVGAYLLGLWGLPYTLVEAVAQHHAPWESAVAGIDVVGAVHLGAAFAEAAMKGDLHDVTLDEGFVRRAGLQGRLPQIISLVEETIAQHDASARSSDEPAVPLH
jgi:HD-like signal output (HDOD) protein/CheY-like chemotaxis protein